MKKENVGLSIAFVRQFDARTMIMLPRFGLGHDGIRARRAAIAKLHIETNRFRRYIASRLSK